jgi:Cdc6-like AAA superfamily ATPase
MWLHGIPGCGKTILSSTIISHLEESSLTQPLLYFYFDFNDPGKQTLENLVRALVNQLYCKRKDTQGQLNSLFSSCDTGRRQPSWESLNRIFLRMLDQVKEVWIVLDALDECITRKGLPDEGLLSWLKELVYSEQRNVHLLVTSRPEQDIESVLSKLAHDKEDIISIQSELINDDILSYVHTEIREGERLKRWRLTPNIQAEIETELTKKADGM